MPNFAANLSMMFQEVGFLDRFAAAAGCGFRAVEYLFPYDHDAAEPAARLRIGRPSGESRLMNDLTGLCDDVCAHGCWTP